MLIRTLLCCAAACLVAVPNAFAAVVWNEATAGDLSNSGTSPTFIALAAGSNQILGTTGAGAAGVDRDYFSFTLPAGGKLLSLTVLPGTGVLGNVSFIGVQSGPQVTVLPTSASAAGLLGWTHYGAADVGTNILPRIGIASNGSTGFSAPLGAGTYSFWIQEFGSGSASYGFDLSVALVPEPAAAALMLAGLAVVVAGASRRAANQFVAKQ